MQEPILISGRDTLLVAVPFILVLLIGVFRLDEVFSASRASLNRRRPACGLDEHGEPIFTDPDGRVVKLRRRPKRMENGASSAGLVSAAPVIEGVRG